MPFACPDCGAPVSEGAAVCPACGFPIRRDAAPAASAAPGPGARRPRNMGLIIAAIVAAGFCMLVVVGIVAAIAIPRFSGFMKRAYAQDAELRLRSLYQAERAYADSAGTYTSDLSKVSAFAWKHEPRNYDFSVSAAGERQLCLDAVPRRMARQAPPLSMDQDGRLHGGTGCTGPVQEPTVPSFDP
jgi:type IV pilus assembly protein PilE